MIDEKENEGEFNEEELVQEFGEGQNEEEEEGDEIMEFDGESSSEGSELASFESAEIEEQEFIDDDKVLSIIESLLFATDKPLKLSTMKQAFQGSSVKKQKIEKALESLMIEYADPKRGVSIEEVQGGYQLRTKVDNVAYLKRLNKARPFKLSGPALEVLSIVAYKQPIVKSEVDQIRGVESGHLMRALMDKRLIRFDGKSELPGKPMLYSTTRYFLEIFGLRSIKELPSLSEIDQLIPEGIGEEEEDKEDLTSVSQNLGAEQGASYSESEEELGKIANKLSEIDTTTEFFEQEKQREKERKEALRAKEIQEAIEFEEEVSDKDRRWLERYNQKLEEARLAKEAEEKKVELEPEPEQKQEQAEATTSEEEPEKDLYDEIESLQDHAEPNEVAKEVSGLDFVEENLDGFDFDEENKDNKENEV